MSELLHHSDSGSQCTSEQFQRLTADHSVVFLMNRSDDVRDNVALESFFLSLNLANESSKRQQSVVVLRSGQG
jgi:putative transposase